MDNTIPGTLKQAGTINIFVPDDYHVVTGNNMGEPDDNQIWLHTTPPGFTDYFWIIANADSESVDNSLEMTKQFNDGTDVEEFTAGNMVCYGVTYDYNSITCNVLKGQLDDTYFQITIIGHELTSPEVLTVLASISRI